MPVSPTRNQSPPSNTPDFSGILSVPGPLGGGCPGFVVITTCFFGRSFPKQPEMAIVKVVLKK